jgi:glyoxylase-like metal-dependent hydrolase (beta-lactamase superfamily II)
VSGVPAIIGSVEPWFGGQVLPSVICVLAGNPSPLTLDGTNTWVVSGGGSAVVIDPGPDDEAHLAAVQQVLEHRDLRPEVILLTHGHPDHSAGARLFANSLGVAVRALDPAHRLGSEGLGDGDVIEVGDRPMEVLATPGHSSDSLSFYLPHEQAVLTGDTLLGRGSTVVAWPDGSLGQYLDSLDRLRSLGQERALALALPGHGPTVDDPQTLLGQYIEHRHDRLEQVRGAIEAGASSVAQVVEMVYEPLPPGVYPAAFASACAQWEYLTGRPPV